MSTTLRLDLQHRPLPHVLVYARQQDKAMRYHSHFRCRFPLWNKGNYTHLIYKLFHQTLNVNIPYSDFFLIRDIPVLLHSVYDLPCFKIGQAKATLQVRDTNLPVFLCYPYCFFVVRHTFATAGVLAPLSTNRQSLSGIFLFSI